VELTTWQAAVGAGIRSVTVDLWRSETADEGLCQLSDVEPAAVTQLTHSRTPALGSVMRQDSRMEHVDLGGIQIAYTHAGVGPRTPSCVTPPTTRAPSPPTIRSAVAQKCTSLVGLVVLVVSRLYPALGKWFRLRVPPAPAIPPAEARSAAAATVSVWAAS
jgi:hypothetical protein